MNATQSPAAKQSPLAEKLRLLRLSTMADELEPALERAAKDNLSTREALDRLAGRELEERRKRAVQRRFRESRLHAQWDIDSFDFGYHTSRKKAKARVLGLLDLGFIEQGNNVILLGNPGVGKTFLAKILGWRACQANIRVLFTPAMDMLNQLIASQADHSLIRRLNAYAAPQLLIVDELGYLALDQHASNLFFQVISTRYTLRRSTLITTNTAFSEWGNILHSTTIATAVVDRLVEDSEILLLAGESMRKAKKRRSLQNG